LKDVDNQQFALYYNCDLDLSQNNFDMKCTNLKLSLLASVSLLLSITSCRQLNENLSENEEPLNRESKSISAKVVEDSTQVESASEVSNLDSPDEDPKIPPRK